MSDEIRKGHTSLNGSPNEHKKKSAIKRPDPRNFKNNIFDDTIVEEAQKDCKENSEDKTRLRLPKNFKQTTEVNFPLANQMIMGESYENLDIAPELKESGWDVFTYAHRKGCSKSKDRIIAFARLMLNGSPVTLTPKEWSYQDSFGTFWQAAQKRKNSKVLWTCTLKDIMNLQGKKTDHVSYSHKSMKNGAQIINKLKNTHLQIRLAYHRGTSDEDLTEKEIIEIFNLSELEQKMFKKEQPDLEELEYRHADMPLLPIDFSSVDFEYILGYPAFFKLSDKRGGLYVNTLVGALNATHRFKNEDMENYFLLTTRRLRRDIHMVYIGKSYIREEDGWFKFNIKHNPNWNRNQIRSFNRALKRELDQYCEAGVISEASDLKGTEESIWIKINRQEEQDNEISN